MRYFVVSYVHQEDKVRKQKPRHTNYNLSPREKILGTLEAPGRRTKEWRVTQAAGGEGQRNGNGTKVMPREPRCKGNKKSISSLAVL